MEIPNYYKKLKQSKRKLNHFLDEDFRMLIADQLDVVKPGNTLMHILREPWVNYDKLFIFTPNQHQEKMVNFEKLMDKISGKVAYDVLTMGNSEDILDTTEYPENIRNIVIFDDLVNASNEVQNRIANHYTLMVDIIM